MEVMEKPYRIEIGKQIVALRKEKGLSQVKLGELAGLDPAHIGRIELGRYNLKVDTLEKVIEALGCTIEIVKK